MFPNVGRGKAGDARTGQQIPSDVVQEDRVTTRQDASTPGGVYKASIGTMIPIPAFPCHDSEEDGSYREEHHPAPKHIARWSDCGGALNNLLGPCTAIDAEAQADWSANAEAQGYCQATDGSVHAAARCLPNGFLSCA